MFLTTGDMGPTAQASSHAGGAEITSAGWWWRCCLVLTAAPPPTVTFKRDLLKISRTQCTEATLAC